MDDKETPVETHTESVTSRPTRYGKSIISFYYKPMTQIVLLGFVFFLEPGMFNALNGLGGGGRVNGTTSANANTAVYATFAVMAFFAGCVCSPLPLGVSELTPMQAGK